MKNCTCKDNGCKGKVERFEIYSPKESTYPERFWGVVDYCENHKQDDINSGFILKEANDQESCYVL